MSYEGYTELLCIAGHYACHDVYAERPAQCDCGMPWRWSHGVDQTNGYDESHEATCDAPKTLVGFEDDWHTDHHGNRYAIKRNRYKPGEHWIMINRKGQATPPYPDDLSGVAQG